VQWLLEPSSPVKVAGKSGISQARTRLGVEPLKELYDTNALSLNYEQQ
jgi:hypothetical protein